MSRPLSRPEAEAARIAAEADAWTRCYRAVTGHDPSPTDERTCPWDAVGEERVDRHVAALDTHDPKDTRNEQDRYDNWLERETP